MKAPLTLTADAIRAAYELLRTQAPFATWVLPDAAALKFSVTGHLDQHGDWGDGEIRVSRNAVSTLDTLLETVAHEMCHVADALAGTEQRGVEHGAVFRKRWRAACARHGWDYARSMPTGLTR